MSDFRLTRRQVTTGLAASAAAGAAAQGARAQEKGHVVFVGYGGRPQDVQRKIYFEPFEKATGIKVVDTTGISLTKIRTMIKTGNVEWDVFQGVPGDVLVLAGEGNLETIDYAKMDKAIMDQLPAEGKLPFGVGYTWSSQVICFNTKAFPPGKPRPASWKDFWDVAKFPGRRMLPAGDYVVNPIEPALLADGVERDKLYPLDLPRAYRSLTRLKPHITKWVSSSTAIPQGLVDGEIDLGMAAAGRIAELKASGAPIDFVYDEGIINFSILAIPKGAKNYENALKLISAIQRPEAMAEYARQFYYGAVNSKSLEFLKPDEQKPLNSYPENFDKQVRMRPDWWAERDASGKSNLDKNAQLWNTWIL